MQFLDGFVQKKNNFQNLSVTIIDDYLGMVCIESLPQWLE